MSDAPCDDTATWTKLVQWIRSSGGYVHEALELRNGSNGRGVYTRCAISKDELLCAVPFALCWSKEAALQELSAFSNGEELRRLPTTALIISHILAEMCGSGNHLQKLDLSGCDSKRVDREPHAAALSSAGPPHLPMLWTKEEREQCLLGTELDGLGSEQRRQAFQDWKLANKLIFSRFVNFFPPSKCNFTSSMHARALLLSRGMDFMSAEGSKHRLLIPMCDLFNHDPELDEPCHDLLLLGDLRIPGSGRREDPLEAWRMNALLKQGISAENEAHLTDDRPWGATYFAGRSYSAGDEVGNSYGTKGSAELLLLHGFTLEGSRHNYVRLKLPALPKAKSDVESNLRKRVYKSIQGTKPQEGGDEEAAAEDSEHQDSIRLGPGAWECRLFAGVESTVQATTSSKRFLRLCRAHALLSGLSGSDAAAAADAKNKLEDWLRRSKKETCLPGHPGLASPWEQAARSAFREALQARRAALEPATAAATAALEAGSAGAVLASALRRIELSILERTELEHTEATASSRPAKRGRVEGG